jgi:hypothetical protein
MDQNLKQIIIDTFPQYNITFEISEPNERNNFSSGDRIIVDTGECKYNIQVHLEAAQFKTGVDIVDEINTIIVNYNS